jgi:hypothetical protein
MYGVGSAQRTHLRKSKKKAFRSSFARLHRMYLETHWFNSATCSHAAL